MPTLKSPVQDVIIGGVTDRSGTDLYQQIMFANLWLGDFLNFQYARTLDNNSFH